MPTEKKKIISPYYGMLLIEARGLMKDGWAIKKGIRRVWKFQQFNLRVMYQMELFKTNKPVDTSEVEKLIRNHLDELHKYNEDQTLKEVRE